MKKLEYTPIGITTSFSSIELIGKDILAVIKDGIGCSKIVTSTPTGNQAQYGNATGTISFATEILSDVVVFYQDAANVCFSPAIQDGYQMPDVNVGFPYNSSFYISGSKDFTISAVTKPSWLSYSLSGDLLTFTGTPAITNEGINTVKFTISNACGSIDFNQSFNVNSVDAQFGLRTYISGDRLNEVESVNITGMPGVIVTVTLTTLTNPNGGTLKVNGVVAAQGDTYNITLDTNGGTLKTEINGIDSPGTVIRGLFTITSVSAGNIGFSQTYQTSKVF